MSPDRLALALAAALALPVAAARHASDFATLQQAVDDCPGESILLDGREFVIERRIRLDENSATSLIGPGRIVQTNPDEPIVELEHATGVAIRGVTCSRSPHADATAPGVLVGDCDLVTLESLVVDQNRSRRGAIELRGVRRALVARSTVSDYKAIAVDDRTGPAGSRAADLYGYAFRCIDGTGILADACTDLVITENVIVESRLRPTAESRELHGLGDLTAGAHAPTAGRLAAEVRRRRSVRNWHQGSAILVTAPTVSARVVVSGNTIASAGQGIDLHADEVVCTGNRIDGAMIGIKATHGCRRLCIAGNTIERAALWGILVNPGSASTPENRDEDILIAGNTIAHTGEGEEAWNWGAAATDPASCHAIYLDGPQVPEAPPLRDVRVLGNTVPAGTGFAYAMCLAPQAVVDGRPVYPEGLIVIGNDLGAGREGVSNVPLELFTP